MSLFLYQELKLIIPQRSIAEAYLSFPKGRELRDRHSKGFVRDSIRASSHMKLPYRDYDSNFRLYYGEHLKNLDIAPGIPLLAISNGNLGNNLRFVSYSQVEGLFELPDEGASSGNRDYACLYLGTDGRLALEKISFPGGRPQPDPGIRWATAGQPIVWDSNVVPLSEIVSEFYDLRHVFHLPMEARVDEATRELARKRHDELMAVYMEVLAEPRHEANARLIQKAKALGLEREANYLQSAIGVNVDSIFLVQRHGLVEDVAQTLVKLGAERAILLDQGGSIGTFFRGRPRSDGEPSPGSFIFASHYFRERRLSLLVFLLTDDNIFEAGRFSGY